MPDSEPEVEELSLAEAVKVPVTEGLFVAVGVRVSLKTLALLEPVAEPERQAEPEKEGLALPVELVQGLLLTEVETVAVGEVEGVLVLVLEGEGEAVEESDLVEEPLLVLEPVEVDDLVVCGVAVLVMLPELVLDAEAEPLKVDVADALGEPPCEAEPKVLPLAEAEGEAEGLGVAEGEWLALVEREAAGALGVPAPGEAEGLREALGLCEGLRELEVQWEALVEAVVEREPELLSELRALAVPRFLLPEAVAQRLVLTVALRLRVGLREREGLEVADRLRVAQPEAERERAVDLLTLLVAVLVFVEDADWASAPGACRDSSSSAPESVGRAAAAAG